MTEKPTTNVIEMGTQAEFDPVSPMSGGGSSATPVKNLFSPRPDGTKRAIDEHVHAPVQPEDEVFYGEEEKHSPPRIAEVEHAVLRI